MVVVVPRGVVVVVPRAVVVDVVVRADVGADRGGFVVDDDVELVVVATVVVVPRVVEVDAGSVVSLVTGADLELGSVSGRTRM